MPQPFVGFSLQRFPLTGIARPSRGRFCSHAVVHRRAETLLPEPYHRRFHRLPRFWRSCLVPPTTMGSLFTRRGALPGHPGSKPQNRFVPPASPASKPSSSRESVHDDPSCPESPADPLLGFRLSEAFSCHARGPRTRPGHEDLNMPPSPEGSRTRLEGP